ncbi:hypothetical protein A3F27_01730 [Candidatus Kaiserbacteria bacterium RIFCSPHIGHO2_12_FULL_53_13]|uniref:Twin-arginine translocation signal domain-containing protein n=1 Tax=Candidatus Kaiserbacteria bacterium RIFCSPHIGHO2_12_FULL_53_13 TaxID=1798502 RepID=A0A1F6EAG6_9BACT|nr:MAG: hypothetical protein A3F27_01730 [Candidatus Kaiserbacteria bacterium RIFCSPHIGHO2_12_FULL_53_13]
MIEKYHAGDDLNNREPQIDKSRRGFLRTAAAGVAAGVVGDRLVSKLNKPTSIDTTGGPAKLLSPKAQEALRQGNPEAVETGRGLIRRYTEMLYKENQSCIDLERQLQELLENDPDNEGQMNLLLSGIRLSTKQQELYMSARRELMKWIPDHREDSKPEKGMSKGKPVKRVEA